MQHIIPISGKDSLAAYIVQKSKGGDYQAIFNDTGLELPETYQWLDKVEVSLGIKIKRIGKDLTEIIYEQGILPSPKVRFCTRLSKIYPMEDYFGKEPTTVYFGIRADEKRIGYQTSKRANITPRYPLVEEGININGVYSILDNLNLMPPSFHWVEIYNRVVDEVGFNIIGELSRQEKQVLFSWRSRPNCYNCFYQRQYEFIGLWEHHPDLFEEACQLENEVGADGFTIRTNGSLRELIKRADQIKTKRVKDIVKYIRSKQQLNMFAYQADELQMVSCGLFCGK